MTAKKNTSTAIAMLSIGLGMFLLAFASVPLYRVFCQVTGFGGTTQEASSVPVQIGKRIINVQFNADTDPNLPWKFKPEQRQVAVHTGEQTLIYYAAENISDEAVTGVATYNVTPNKAGAYFNKVQCFCFTNQTLNPDEKMPMPVSFFIDPEIENDPNLQDVSTITLSYTFFKVKESL